MNKFFVKNPIISEKSTQLSALRKYVFLVDKNAAKPEIRKIIENAYKVNITDVRIINVKSKKKILGQSGDVSPRYKKSMITLRVGQRLDVLPH